MDRREVLLVNGIMALMKEHGYVGFVGSFVKHEGHVTDCLTTNIVAPGYDKRPFQLIEGLLSGVVNSVFNAKGVSRETSKFIDPDFLKHS